MCIAFFSRGKIKKRNTIRSFYAKVTKQNKFVFLLCLLILRKNLGIIIYLICTQADVPMTADEFKVLETLLAPHSQLHSHWFALLVEWINRAEGYMEMLTLDDNDSSSRFLLEHLSSQLQALSQQHQHLTDSVLSEALKDFEILFLHASAGGEHWDSTQECFLNFVQRCGYPHQTITDIPHTSPEVCRHWIGSYL